MLQHPDRRRLPALLGALIALGCAAPAAVAQEEGVHVDPGSPTGKEYAIPFDTARREAAPSGGGGGGAATAPAPLFGAGIVAAGAGGSGEGSATSGSAEAPAATGGSNGGGGGGEPQAESPASGQAAATLEAATQTPGAPGGGLGTPVMVGLLTAGLLLAGGIAGALVRRTRG